MSKIKAYGADASDQSIVPMEIERRAVTPDDVEIKILYCGICHSDIHQVRNNWKGTRYPIVPGHEIVGEVINIGNKVSKFKLGDVVGVGCMVDSCQSCNSCDEGLEQYCENGYTDTYNAEDKKHGGITYGGYSEKIIVDQKFVLTIPKNLSLIEVPPLLCAGITTWSPLMHWEASKKESIAIVGLGGLGHMAIKFAHALGTKVSLITTSHEKGEDAISLGADNFILSTDPKQLDKYKESFDLIISTVPKDHDLSPYFNLLRRDGTIVILGSPVLFDKDQLNGAELIKKRRSLSGSLIGGIKETQEMLDFCGKHDITSDIEVVKPNQINYAYERVLKNDIKYRFVIDFTDKIVQ